MAAKFSKTIKYVFSRAAKLMSFDVPAKVFVCHIPEFVMELTIVLTDLTRVTTVM